MTSEDKGRVPVDRSMEWSLARWVPPNSGFGPSQIFSIIRQLEDGELETIDAAEALFRNFGVGFASNVAIRLANEVGDTARSLLSAIKRSGGEVNQADVNRFRWALVEFAKHIVSWTTDSEVSEILGEVATAPAIVDCSLLASGADFGIAIEPQQSGATNFVLTALDPANPGRRVNALGLMQWAMHTCQPLAARVLLDAEEDLTEAAKRLMSFQIEVMWGSPVLAALPEPGSGQLQAATSLQPRPIAFGDIAPVLAACEIARKQESQVEGSPETPLDLDASGGNGSADAAGATSAKAAGTGHGAASEENETGSGTTVADQPVKVHAPAIDITALLREATALATESEQSWSITQGAGLLETINDLEGRAASVLMALQAQVTERSGLEATAGILGWPMSTQTANGLVGNPSGPVTANQKGLAAVLAVANLVDAMAKLRVPTNTTFNLLSGDQLSWWSPDAFTRLRSAAALAVQTIARDTLFQPDKRRWCLDRAQQSLNAGLIDASMLYLLAAIGDDEITAEPLAGALAALRTSVERFLDSGISRPDVALPIALYWLHQLQQEITEPAIDIPHPPTDD